MPPYSELRSELKRRSLLGDSLVTPDSQLIERRGGRFLPPTDVANFEFEQLLRLSRRMGEVGVLDLSIPMPKPDQLERVDIDEELGCWNLHTYIDQKNRARYGSLSVPGIPGALAHRTMYMIYFGVSSLPNGRYDFLDHVCETKSCCYPRHLEKVSHAENNRRGHSRATHEHGTLDIWGSS